MFTSLIPALRLASAALLCAAVTDAAAQARIQPQDFFRLRSVGDVVLSRDGTRVAYSVTTTSLR